MVVEVVGEEPPRGCTLHVHDVVGRDCSMKGELAVDDIAIEVDKMVVKDEQRKAGIEGDKLAAPPSISVAWHSMGAAVRVGGARKTVLNE